MGKEILSEAQVRFLNEVGQDEALTDKFYLTGGTALAAFYLNHRDSEDLDFFSEEEVDPLAVQTFLKLKKKSLRYQRIEFQKSFNRNLFFLLFRGGILKTEFTHFPFTVLEKGKREGLLRIDSLRDIAVNKFFTIYQKPRLRDFIDLFFIMRREQWGIQELLADARLKFDTHIDLLQLGAQLLKVNELEDFPKMRMALDRKKMEEFFYKLAAAFKKDILR